MSGCTNCKGKSGCDDRKGPMLATIDGELARLYPSKTWGMPAGEPLFGSASDPDLLPALAEELTLELNCATFVVHGNEDEPCDYIYILAFGRTPCIMQAREDANILAPFADAGDAPSQELYLRLVISHRTNFCALQQVAMELVRDGEAWVIRETPRAGVYDAPLLKRMQKLVAILPAYDLVHLDFGEIAHSPPGFEAGEWAERYLGKPSIANYFFYPQPTTMATTQAIV